MGGANRARSDDTAALVILTYDRDLAVIYDNVSLRLWLSRTSGGGR